MAIRPSIGLHLDRGRRTPLRPGSQGGGVAGGDHLGYFGVVGLDADRSWCVAHTRHRGRRRDHFVSFVGVSDDDRGCSGALTEVLVEDRLADDGLRLVGETVEHGQSVGAEVERRERETEQHDDRRDPGDACPPGDPVGEPPPDAVGGDVALVVERAGSGAKRSNDRR